MNINRFIISSSFVFATSILTTTASANGEKSPTDSIAEADEASTFLEDGRYHTNSQRAAYCDEIVTFSEDKIYLEAAHGRDVDCGAPGSVFTWTRQPDGTYTLGSGVIKIINPRAFLIVNYNVIFRKISDQ